MSARYAGKKNTGTKHGFSKNAAFGLVDSLKSAVNACNLRIKKSVWSNYYRSGVHSENYIKSKEKIVSGFLSHIKPSTVWDLGTNTGHFAKLSAKMGFNTLAFDSDPMCVENLYQSIPHNSTTSILPLVCDLTNPSPSIGWDNRERQSLSQRGPADLVIALALIHHLAIGNNVPFNLISSFFARLGKWLILEFVPISDPQVSDMLTVRENIFDDHTCENLVKQFSVHFIIHKQAAIENSGRTILLMEKR